MAHPRNAPNPFLPTTSTPKPGAGIIISGRQIHKIRFIHKLLDLIEPFGVRRQFVPVKHTGAKDTSGL